VEGIDEIGLDVGATLALGIGATSALAQTKEVTFAHQDMVVPFRVLQAAGDSEKATGYKINWKMFGGGGDVIKAMASGEVPIGEVGSSPRWRSSRTRMSSPSANRCSPTFNAAKPQ
jgi:ABC-type taurine transport system substrate-binding protein